VGLEVGSEVAILDEDPGLKVCRQRAMGEVR
jgi:hypothetical protein